MPCAAAGNVHTYACAQTAKTKLGLPGRTNWIARMPLAPGSPIARARSRTLLTPRHSAGACDPSTYPLQKKRHGLDFLRGIAHLRARTNVIGAVMRVRSALAQATHDFFAQNGFLYVHTPIISAADCEGAGEMFQVRAAKYLRGKGMCAPVARDLESSDFPVPEWLSNAGHDAAVEARRTVCSRSRQVGRAAGRGCCISGCSGERGERQGQRERLRGRRRRCASRNRAASETEGAVGSSEASGARGANTQDAKRRSGLCAGLLRPARLSDGFWSVEWCEGSAFYGYCPPWAPGSAALPSATPAPAAQHARARRAGEMYASALGDVYTFGPTFRAENSNTSRHLAEFWMIEPELAFADLSDDIDCAEAYLKHCVAHILEHCAADLQFFDQRVEKGLLARLRSIAARPFVRCSYTDAVAHLTSSGADFEFPVTWGCDLQSEHERHLTEVVFEGVPVFVTDYPKDIKAFYMRLNDDGKTVAAMDLLVPRVGELIGGSQREDRIAVLLERMAQVRGLFGGMAVCRGCAVMSEGPVHSNNGDTLCSICIERSARLHPMPLIVHDADLPVSDIRCFERVGGTSCRSLCRWVWRQKTTDRISTCENTAPCPMRGLGWDLSGSFSLRLAQKTFGTSYLFRDILAMRSFERRALASVLAGILCSCTGVRCCITRLTLLITNLSRAWHCSCGGAYSASMHRCDTSKNTVHVQFSEKNRADAQSLEQPGRGWQPLSVKMLAYHALHE